MSLPAKLAPLILVLFALFSNISQSAKPNNKTDSKKEQKNADSNSNSSLPIEEVQRFTSAITKIKNYYVKNVNDTKLFEDAIRGMLQGLDPHSNYLSEDDFNDLNTSTRGEFGGLGIEVTMDNGFVKVIAPIDGTPAYKIGMKSGDYIIKLDDKSVRGMKLKDAVKKMRGKIGSTIKLTVIRKNEKKPLIFNIVRDSIQIQSVKFELIEGKYGYIRISLFQETTSKDFIKAIKKLNKLSKNNIKGLILDLRNNPGGLLDSAIEVSDTLIHNDQKGEEELIVYTKGRQKYSEITAVATPGDILKGKPMVVLINEGSASGSEIVAGALKDNKRAILIGTKSFGKGSVQTIIPLGDKHGLKLTTALYYTPSGRSIQAKGLEPDILVENMKFTVKKVTNNKELELTEADLLGHIGRLEDTKNITTDKKSKSKILENDYQLKEALNILKAMQFMHKT